MKGRPSFERRKTDTAGRAQNVAGQHYVPSHSKTLNIQQKKKTRDTKQDDLTVDQSWVVCTRNVCVNNHKKKKTEKKTVYESARGQKQKNRKKRQRRNRGKKRLLRIGIPRQAQLHCSESPLVGSSGKHAKKTEYSSYNKNKRRQRVLTSAQRRGRHMHCLKGSS